MPGPKISIDCALPYEGPGGHAPTHQAKWAAANESFWKGNDQFGKIMDACIAVLAQIGEVAKYIEVIKILPVKADYTVASEPGPRNIFQTHVILGGGQKQIESDKFEIDLSSPDPERVKLALTSFKSRLFREISDLVHERAESARHEYQSWRKLSPPPIPAE